jgi:outer membrane receptor protein involved in Fe transport
VAAERGLSRYGAALEYEVHPFPGTGVVVGYAHHWLTAETLATRDGEAFGGGVYQDLPDGTRLRLSAAKRFRFPTIRQLYDETAGNTALEVERATTVELGAERALPARSRVALVLFHTDVRDYIERLQDEPFANYDAYRFRGLEFEAETRAWSGLLLRVGASVLGTEDQSPGAEREELQYRPHHRLTFEGRYALGSGLATSVSVLHVGRQVYYSRREPVQQATLPPYTLVGARLTHGLFAGRVEGYVGAENLLNDAYEEEYGAPQATRMVYAGLSARW